jgi:hypothetical protein
MNNMMIIDMWSLHIRYKWSHKYDEYVREEKVALIVALLLKKPSMVMQIVNVLEPNGD